MTSPDGLVRLCCSNSSSSRSSLCCQPPAAQSSLLCSALLCLLHPPGILRSIILSQLAPQRLSLVPNAPQVLPLAELLEEAAAVAAAAEDGVDDGEDSEEDDNNNGFVMRAADGSAEMRDAVSFQVAISHQQSACILIHLSTSHAPPAAAGVAPGDKPQHRLLCPMVPGDLGSSALMCLVWCGGPMGAAVWLSH
jgi:hypothetical protein